MASVFRRLRLGERLGYGQVIFNLETDTGPSRAGSAIRSLYVYFGTLAQKKCRVIVSRRKKTTIKRGD